MLRKFVIIAIVFAVFNAEACPNDKMCEQCEGSKCSSCHDSYPDANGVCKEPDTKVENCEHYSSATACADCGKGYYLKDNKCMKIDIDKCLAVNTTDTTKCIACDNGKKPNAGKCDGDTACSAENCSICTSDFCVECKDGYVLSTSLKCEKSDLEGCLLLGTDTATCTVCEHGYYDSGTVCKKNASILSAIVLFVSALIMA